MFVDECQIKSLMRLYVNRVQPRQFFHSSDSNSDCLFVSLMVSSSASMSFLCKTLKSLSLLCAWHIESHTFCGKRHTPRHCTRDQAGPVDRSLFGTDDFDGFMLFHWSSQTTLGPENSGAWSSQISISFNFDVRNTSSGMRPQGAPWGTRAACRFQMTRVSLLHPAPVSHKLCEDKALVYMCVQLSAAAAFLMNGFRPYLIHTLCDAK